MNAIYLASYALRFPWVEGSGKAHVILQEAVVAGGRSTTRGRGAPVLGPLPRNRAIGSRHDSHHLACSLTREECAVAGETPIFSFLGIVQGFPIVLRVCRKEKEGFATFVLVDDEGDIVVPTPPVVVSTFDISVGWCDGGGLAEAVGGGWPPAGIGDVQVKLTPDHAGWIKLVTAKTLEEGCFIGDFDGAGWELVVAPGSPYFDARGVMEIEVHMVLNSCVV